mmetsp:Transcript_7802/g.7047  ORF Transcript_7802/g.7047 Transcript_7802/m.7047 type:complete len:103 (-) Transcript_7802:553-861(-)|eukprot:CAMPEP_0114583838 /NCGR_PEP_ID=MMETSP0125-20121206/7521_1 /TAXON_ID=485358 ORGANISM="Aristerostoma sp., Strain ATCC 50986" /NCGR_SAMPLE_ID=MMETSP0125 /ASSEMBLY_ACC=CAM_ASM_000245 /LENGTH=102 /DNA_ID=CAMNT_0001777595 /DNA_START=248 /DNA_END=556 /DNA_ORIENTATION=-
MDRTITKLRKLGYLRVDDSDNDLILRRSQFFKSSKPGLKRSNDKKIFQKDPDVLSFVIPDDLNMSELPADDSTEESSSLLERSNRINKVIHHHTLEMRALKQ